MSMQMTAKEHFLQVEDKQTPNPLDESELRKKANGLWDELRTISTKLNDDCYGKILDFAKYYHSIQPKAEPKEGKYIAANAIDCCQLYDSYDEAIQTSKEFPEGHYQIFKLVAEVEKVTTINVKEV